ncbi:MAG: hypothetical protein AAB263_08710 [Planctomycetota bacterium]
MSKRDPHADDTAAHLEIAQRSDGELIGRFLDGPADAGLERELARRISADPACARLLRRHLLIAELADQHATVERGGERFAAGWNTRLAAESDAAVFTTRTMMRIAAYPPNQRTELVVVGLRFAGLAAAAGLLISLGWVASSTIEHGRRWLNEESLVRIDNPAVNERGNALRHLREEQQ